MITQFNNHYSRYTNKKKKHFQRKSNFFRLHIEKVMPQNASRNKQINVELINGSMEEIMTLKYLGSFKEEWKAHELSKAQQCEKTCYIW